MRLIYIATDCRLRRASEFADSLTHQAAAWQTGRQPDWLTEPVDRVAVAIAALWLKPSKCCMAVASLESRLLRLLPRCVSQSAPSPSPSQSHKQRAELSHCEPLLLHCNAQRA